MNAINSRKILGKLYNADLMTSLKKLNVETRNKVRAIFTSDDADAIKILNKLRRDLPVRRLLDVETAISAFHGDASILPENFPTSFQTHESYVRLDPLQLNKHLSLVDVISQKEIAKLESYIISIGRLNQAIVNRNFFAANNEIKLIVDQFGFSHFLLRKIVLIRELYLDDTQDEYLLDLLNEAVSNSKVIAASVMHCYQEEQDYLGIKRSIMGLANRGDDNKYTRDISRLTFHVHAVDSNELNDLIQSNLQSSLLDALIIIKVNARLIDLSKYKYITKLIEQLESTSPSVDEMVSLNGDDEDTEYLFIKQSSAWLESSKIINYRYLIDHFYDSPDSDYFKMTKELIELAGSEIRSKDIESLLSPAKLMNEIGEKLHSAQQKGGVTRSAIFNYLVFTQQSNLVVSEEQLYQLMCQTSALDRTIHVTSMKLILPMLQSNESKLIFRLLIAKKSRSEIDHIPLKSLMEKILKAKYNGSLVALVENMSIKSEALAFYLYETCNEDFIARMTRVIKTTKEITETRAALHSWRGEYSGENLYLDRARNLKINSQINKIRGEIDDNRIYVDTTRFSEWFVDNISSQMGSILLILDNNNDLSQIENPQLIDLIDKCFNEFCTNSFFGIASYLGRRIRHGTFRGHLYSSVINNIENKYSSLITNSHIEPKWLEWKSSYEQRVMGIINDKLYINSPQKKSGFLYPNLRDSAKKMIVTKCISTIIEHFEIAGNIVGTEAIIIESCWRIAEVDLKKFNSYIKSQKPHLINGSVIANLNNLNLGSDGIKQAKEFERELQSLISEKLNTICTWFKKPQSASPKASLSLLYKAVVSEVQQTYDNFNPDTDFIESEDIELYGGVYHIFYDALYVIIFNAAKHGKPEGNLTRDFNIIDSNDKKSLYFCIHSEIKDSHTESYVSQRLRVLPDEDINNAQVIENRSGIKKLHNLQIMDNKFKVEAVDCKNRHVVTEFSYELGY
ncbi:hypothetical protein [Shewanella donghaensis]|uniref:hypothetical protein n=1 Tax=Shewanella donghaensis TaxID=238836 RepID=UPI001D03F980|nr:hypothetical protein [Shewanella donghaensis]